MLFGNERTHILKRQKLFLVSRKWRANFNYSITKFRGKKIKTISTVAFVTIRLSQYGQGYDHESACTYQVVLSTLLMLCRRISFVSCVAAHDDVASREPKTSSMLKKDGELREKTKKREDDMVEN